MRFHVPVAYRLVIHHCFSIDEERTATDLLSDTAAVISHMGDIAWSMPLISKSACKVNVADYPFDEQRCALKFGSWTYSGAELNLTNYADTAVLEKYETNGEWDVIAMPCVRNEVGYNNNTNNTIYKALKSSGTRAQKRKTQIVNHYSNAGDVMRSSSV